MFSGSSEKKRQRLTIDQICSSVASSVSPTGARSSPTQSPPPFSSPTSSESIAGPSSYEALNLSISNRSSHSSTSSEQPDHIVAQRKHSWPIDGAASTSYSPNTESSDTRSHPDLQESDLAGSSKLEDVRPGLSGDEVGKERRRRQKLANKDNLFCQVCGDKANGYNFGAITCESCKAFFRRNALKNKGLRCNFDNSCKIDHFTRKFCTACRLSKCFAVNMKKEWILNEDALKKRKKLTRRSAREEGSLSDIDTVPFPPLTTTSQIFGASNIPLAHAPGLYMYIDPVASIINDPNTSSDDKDYPALPLNEENSAEIARIMANHALIDTSGSASRSPPIAVKKESAAEGHSMELDSADQPSQVLSIADEFIRKLIKFVKSLNEYRDMCQADQISLLKGGIMETLVIRSAIMYEPSNELYQQYTSQSKAGKDHLKDSFISHGLGEELLTEHCKLITTFNDVAKWDKQILVLVMIINLFNSNRLGVINTQVIKQAEQRYTVLLQEYLRSKHSIREARAIYSQLHDKLTEVHSYSEICAQRIASVTPVELEPLMREIFSMK